MIFSCHRYVSRKPPMYLSYLVGRCGFSWMLTEVDWEPDIVAGRDTWTIRLRWDRKSGYLRAVTEDGLCIQSIRVYQRPGVWSLLRLGWFYLISERLNDT